MKAWKRRAVERHNAQYIAKQHGETLPDPGIGTIGHDVVAVGIDPGSKTQEVVTIDNKGKIGVVGGGVGLTSSGRAIMRQLAIQKIMEHSIDTDQI